VEWYDFALCGAVRDLDWTIVLSRRRLDIASTLSISALTLLIAAAAALTLGRLSDSVGRRPMAIWSTAALIGGTAPVVDQLLVTAVGLDIAPGLYVGLVACLA
jgi:MFS family permease